MSTDPSFSLFCTEEETAKSIDSMFADNPAFFTARGIPNKEELQKVLKFQFDFVRKNKVPAKVRLSEGFVANWISKRITGYSVSAQGEDPVSDFSNESSGEGVAFLYGISSCNIDATNTTVINVHLVALLNEIKENGFTRATSTSHTDVVVSFLTSPLHRNMFFLYVKAMAKTDTTKKIRDVSNDPSKTSKTFANIATTFFNNLTKEKHRPVQVWSCYFNSVLKSSGTYVFYNECAPVSSSNPIVIRNPVNGIVVVHSQERFFADVSMLGEAEDHKKIVDAMPQQYPPNISSDRLIPIHVPIVNMNTNPKSAATLAPFLTKFQETSFVYYEGDEDNGFFDSYCSIISTFKTIDNVSSELFKERVFDMPLIPISSMFPVIQPETRRMSVQDCIEIAERTKSSVVRLGKEDMDKAGFFIKIMGENGYGYDSIKVIDGGNMTVMPVEHLLHKKEKQ